MTKRKDAPRSRSSLVTLSVSPPLPAKPAGGAGLGAWQWVLVGGVGAPAVFLVGLYAARRRHKADKDQLLNLVERVRAC